MLHRRIYDVNKKLSSRPCSSVQKPTETAPFGGREIPFPRSSNDRVIGLATTSTKLRGRTTGRSRQARSDITPCGRELVTDVSVLDGDPENEYHQKYDQGVFDKSLAVFLNEQSF